jgi:splicing factor U2AF subunit
LIGNVYARFKYEDSAQKACDDLNSRWYAARRLNSGEGCVRGGFCNFIHRKNPGEELDRELTLSTKKYLKMTGKDQKTPSRSPTPEPSRRRF